MSLLRATDLLKHYPVRQGLFKQAKVQALNGVSLSLEAGQTLAIVGESGCGKSTLARLLALLATPTSGQLEILGINAQTASAAERKRLRQNVQMVFQNPYASLNPRQSIGAQLLEPLKLNTRLSKAAQQEALLEMLSHVGLSAEHASRYAHQFSGGQRQRIAIARAMMLKPALVIADEPTAALDVSIQAQILNLFKDLQAEYQTALVFISHNLPVVRYIADQVLVMYLGKVVESGPAEAIYQTPKHPYSQALLAATPRLTATQSSNAPLRGELPSPLTPPSGCAFHPRCPKAKTLCQHQTPMLRLIGAQQVACHYA